MVVYAPVSSHNDIVKQDTKRVSAKALSTSVVLEAQNSFGIHRSQVQTEGTTSVKTLPSRVVLEEQSPLGIVFR